MSKISVVTVIGPFILFGSSSRNVLKVVFASFKDWLIKNVVSSVPPNEILTSLMLISLMLTPPVFARTSGTT